MPFDCSSSCSLLFYYFYGSMLFCLQLTLSSVMVTVCPAFGNELLTRLTVHTVCSLSISYVSYSTFWVLGQEFFFLTATVRGLCLSPTDNSFLY